MEPWKWTGVISMMTHLRTVGRDSKQLRIEKYFFITRPTKIAPRIRSKCSRRIPSDIKLRRTLLAIQCSTLRDQLLVFENCKARVFLALDRKSKMQVKWSVRCKFPHERQGWGIILKFPEKVTHIFVRTLALWVTFARYQLMNFSKELNVLHVLIHVLINGRRL